MARKFRGSDTQTIDAKGRVSIPASFRRVIEAGDPDWKDGLRASLVIVFGPKSQNFLKCYTVKGIEAIENRIETMKLGSRDRLSLEKIFHTQSLEVQVLEDGRIVLPAKLREKLDLKDKALFVAASDKFLLWNPDAYADEDDTVEEWIASKGPGFDPEYALPEPGAAPAEIDPA